VIENCRPSPALTIAIDRVSLHPRLLSESLDQALLHSSSVTELSTLVTRLFRLRFWSSSGTFVRARWASSLLDGNSPGGVPKLLADRLCFTGLVAACLYSSDCRHLHFTLFPTGPYDPCSISLRGPLPHCRQDLIGNEPPFFSSPPGQLPSPPLSASSNRKLLAVLRRSNGFDGMVCPFLSRSFLSSLFPLI